MRYLVFCLFLIPFHSTCQSFDYHFENLSSNYELARENITHIAQDNQGAIWLSSEIGWTIYDGLSFKPFIHNFLENVSVRSGRLKMNARLPNGNFLINDKNLIYVFDPINEGLKKLELQDPPKDQIYTLLVASDSSIWVSTMNKGLFHYSKNHTLIHHYNIGLPFDGMKGIIFLLYEDEEGNIWCALDQNGFVKLNVRENKFVSYPFLKVDEGFISGISDTINSNSVKSFLEVDSQSMWLGTNSGLVFFDETTNHFTHYRIAAYDPLHPYNNGINCLWYHEGKIWCGTNERGIYLFDVEKRKFVEHFYHIRNKEESIANDQILSFFYSQEFEDGVLWILTGTGLSKVDLYQKPFEIYHSLSTENGTHYFNKVRTIHSDESHLWIGSAGSSLPTLDIINKKTKEGKQYKFDADDPHSIGIGPVGSIVPRSDGKYWITTWRGWLNIFDPQTGKFQKWEGFHNDLGIQAWVFNETVKDKLGNYWFGTIGSGLWKYSEKTGKFIAGYNLLNSGMIDKHIKKIYVDPDGPPEIIWLGTHKGLVKFNSETENFENYLDDLDEYDQLYCNRFVDIYRDSEGIFWISTDDCGIVRFNLVDQSIKSYTMEEGLPTNQVYSIYEDKQGYLWMSTSRGIAKFDPRTEVFRNYFQSFGILGNRFMYGAHTQDADGKLYFGNTKGVISFYPEKIEDNPFLPKVRISGLFVKNIEVNVGDTINGEVLLPKGINELPVLKITHKNHDFALEFRTSHYVNPRQNLYKYKLEGYDEEWQYTDANNRRANYGNLPPGNYIFQVIASNQDGVWAKYPFELPIIILPPWWNTWWFRVSVALFIIICIFLYIRIRTHQLKKQKHLLEKRVEEKTSELQQINDKLQEKNDEVLTIAQQLHESDQAKINFYANVSHEFRTPLTLILGPVNQLLKQSNTPEDLLKIQLGIVKRNADRLKRLISQLLNISELDNGKVRLSVRELDIVSFVKGIVSTFQYIADKQLIKYTIDSNQPSFFCFFDPDKLEKVIYNIVSNAFKFTEENGKITIRMLVSEGRECYEKLGFSLNGHPSKIFFMMEVKDTGCGISQKDLPHIFDRFYQVNDSKKKSIGSGIGLALSKQLIEKHHGQIRADSTLGEGSSFLFLIPVDKGSFSKNEILEDVHANGVSSNKFLSDNEWLDHGQGKSDGKYSTSRGKPKVLLVEDNVDMQMYIQANLQESFDIVLANNGKEGFELATKVIPDMIISDIMMPIMNGVQMCKLLRQETRTSHVPFIFLTAKTDRQDELLGLQQGAEDFISKPFSVDVLEMKVSNILKRRKELQTRIRELGLSVSQDDHISKLDEEFLKKLRNIIEDNILDPEMNAEILAKHMGFSRSHLYRKIKALTGQNITEYIRTYRLQKAAELIRKKEANVSEIAYQVGFNSLSYFSTSFKKHYGSSPQNFEKSK